MDMDATAPINITLTPTLLKVLKEVPTEQLDNALEKAFPQYFAKSEQEAMEARMEAMKRFREMPVPTPKTDVVEMIRKMRAENHGI